MIPNDFFTLHSTPAWHFFYAIKEIHEKHVAYARYVRDRQKTSDQVYYRMLLLSESPSNQ